MITSSFKGSSTLVDEDAVAGYITASDTLSMGSSTLVDEDALVGRSAPSS